QSKKSFRSGSLLPVYGGPGLRIEEFWIQLNVGAHLRVRLGCHNLAIDHEDHFRRHPAAAEFLILVELRLRRLCPILTSGPKHSDKVKILSIDPELRRVQVTGFCSNHVDRPSLPCVFPELR